MAREYFALMGLGAVGAPLANLLYRQYGDKFILLSSKDFLHTLTDRPIYINGEIFAPKIVTEKGELEGRIRCLFLCVKNYHVEAAVPFLKTLLEDNCIIFPLQNGVYSFDYFLRNFPHNIVLEGFAKGPNTALCENGFVYQRPGSFHVGSSNEKWKKAAQAVYRHLVKAGVECQYDENVTREVWKKFMLNVAGNAVTALTGIDYAMFKKAPEVQQLCREVMREFVVVARRRGIELGEKDIDDVIQYYLSFKVSKHTSMLEDALNLRRTENEYIAGYISHLAQKLKIATPRIDMLYSLMKIKESVYLKAYQ